MCIHHDDTSMGVTCRIPMCHVMTTRPWVWHVVFLCVMSWRHVHGCDMSYSYVSRDSPMCDMTHPSVWHDSSIYVMRPIHVCVRIHPCVCFIHVCVSSMYVTRLIHVRDIRYRFVWRISSICVMTYIMWWHTYRCVTRFMDRCAWILDMAYVRHEVSPCVTWLIHMCDMTHPHVWRDSFICVTGLIHMWAMTHP